MLDSLLRLDGSLRIWVATHHSPAVDAVMLFASAVGRRGVIWMVVGGGLMFRRPVRAADVWRLMLALGLAFLMTDAALKPLVRRVRPFTAVMDVRVIDERPKTYSFPSGHAASAFAGAVTMSRGWPQAQPLWWATALLIAFSRIYVGVHYPLDVIGGAIAGMLSAWLVLGGRRCPALTRPLRTP